MIDYLPDGPREFNVNDSNDNQQRLDVFDEIQQVCRDFRRRLKQGESVRIESFLESATGGKRKLLFQNLLHLEIEFRRQAGEEPTSEDYLPRFGDFGKLIRQAFFESTLVSGEGNRETSNAAPLETLGRVAARRIGEYELLEELGRGGFGVVYKAKHLNRNDYVALKTLPVAGNSHAQVMGHAERLHKFRREFRSLSEMNHPNLVGMQTLEVDGEQWFFTMDLVDGDDFLSYIRPGNRFDEQRLRAVLPPLVQGIAALHSEKIVHRDLKPSNVLIDEAGNPVILDFGLADELTQRVEYTASIGGDAFAGTPSYGAPEQFLGTHTEASDWYSLGTMLFEAVTGKLPFQGSFLELAQRKPRDAAPRIGESLVVANDISRLIDGLLETDPLRRPDVTQIANALALEHPSPARESLDTTMSRDVGETDKLLIGRGKQLAQLASTRKDFAASLEPTIVFISGRSGEGKSSLVETFLHPIRQSNDFLVLSGRCYDRESVPYKAIDGIIDSLSAYLRTRSSELLQRLLPDDIHLLARLFPVVRRVKAIADRDFQREMAFDEGQLRARAFFALRELLTRIAVEHPVILFVDDLQWGDADSAQVLLDLLSPPNSPAIMFIGGYRSDESAQSPFAIQWQKQISGSPLQALMRHVEVGPLSMRDCIDLAIRRLGCTRPVVEMHATELLVDTGGNPYLLEQLFDGFNSETQVFEQASLHEIIEKRLAKLPPAAAQLLSAIAVSGKPVPVSEASRFVEDDSTTLQILTHMRSERLVRLIGAAEHPLVDTYHDKIRETVLRHIPPDELRAFHHDIGEALESEDEIAFSTLLEATAEVHESASPPKPIPNRVYDLAFHFLEAQDDRAFAYQLLAGELSARAYALDNALEYFSHAADLMPESCTHKTAYRLWNNLGQVCSRLNSPEEAIEYFEKASEVATRPFEQGVVDVWQGMTYLKTAQLEKATLAFDNALRELGRARSRSSFRTMVGIAFGLGSDLVWPAAWCRARQPADRKAAELEWIVHWGFHHYLFERESIPRFIHSSVRFSNVAKRTGNGHLRAISDSTLGIVCEGLGCSPLAQHFLARSEKVSQGDSNPELKGILLGRRAQADHFQGKLHDANAKIDKAIRIAKECGSSILSILIHDQRHVRGHCSSSLDELESAQEELAIANKTRDRRAVCWGNYGVACSLARSGQLRQSLSSMTLAIASIGDEQCGWTTDVLYGSYAFVLLQHSRFEDAAIAARRSWHDVEKKRHPSIYSVPSYALLLESLAGEDWFLRGQPSQEVAQELRKLLRRSRMLRVMFPIHRAQINRACGRAYWFLGKQKRAAKHFERAVRQAKRVGLGWELARSLLDDCAVKGERLEARKLEAQQWEATELLKKLDSAIPYSQRWLLGDTPDPTCYVSEAETNAAAHWDLPGLERDEAAIQHDP